MLINYSLIFVTLILFAGFAVDAGMLEWRYLKMESSANAGAVAAVLAGPRSFNTTTAARTATAYNGFTNGSNGVAVTVANPPTSGTYSGNSSAYMVTVAQTVPTMFLGIIGINNFSLTASATQIANTQVSLSSSANIYGIGTDGTSQSNNGFDQNGHAFSANTLGQVRAQNGLGALVAWRNQLFKLGAPNTKNGVANTTISLPGGKYSQMLILASTEWGPITGNQFTVTYTNSATTKATFSMSDWCNPSYYTGENIVTYSAYRDYNTTTDSGHQTYIYGYAINLNNSYSLSSLALPATRSIVVFAVGLIP